MTAAGGVDLDDVTGCPVGAVCAGCGTAADLAVATIRVLGGVGCLTLCEPCEGWPLPTLRPLDALSRACRHAEHLGIDVDAMGELVDAEAGER